MSSVIEQWHQIVKHQDAKGLDALLAEDVVFHSPVVHTPQTGKKITRLYLMAAMQVLEFDTLIDGVKINGVDMIEWNDEGQIIDFKVMVRPLKAINAIHQAMGSMLDQLKPKG